jgi:hypothetical protein
MNNAIMATALYDIRTVMILTNSNTGMANTSYPRLGVFLGPVALGVLLVAVLSGCGSEDPTAGQGDPRQAPATEAPSKAGPAVGAPATRRIADPCDPVVEARKYEEFVGRQALAVLSWNNMPERAANLKIPVEVSSVDEGAITVGILDIPLREPYIEGWIRSGHMQRGPGSSYLIDPCSARIEAWEAMDRAMEFGAKHETR